MVATSAHTCSNYTSCVIVCRNTTFQNQRHMVTASHQLNILVSVISTYTVQCIRIFAACTTEILYVEKEQPQQNAATCKFSFCGQCYQRMSLNTNMYDIPWWARARNMNTTVICTSCGQCENIVGSLPASFQGLLNHLLLTLCTNQLGRPEMFLTYNM